MVTGILIALGVVTLILALAMAVDISSKESYGFLCLVFSGASILCFMAAGHHLGEENIKEKAVNAGAAEWVVLSVNEDGSTDTEFKWKVEERPDLPKPSANKE